MFDERHLSTRSTAPRRRTAASRCSVCRTPSCRSRPVTPRRAMILREPRTKLFGRCEETRFHAGQLSLNENAVPASFASGAAKPPERERLSRRTVLVQVLQPRYGLCHRGLMTFGHPPQSEGRPDGALEPLALPPHDLDVPRFVDVSRSASTSRHTDMLTSTLSPSGRSDVASLPSPFSRHTKPGDPSASALMRSRLSTKSLSWDYRVAT
jgi:hypothetical protein